MKREIEATFLSIDKDNIRTKLKGIGFELKTLEYVMRRKTFDFPSSNVKKWGRVRQEFDKVTMTIKEIRGPGINDTYETELIVNDFNTAVSFFEACGVREKAFQENKREVWVRGGVEVTIDTWPGLQPFIEIESENEQKVREVSSELNFDFTEAVFGSIDLIYEKELGVPSNLIIKLKEITFANPPTKDNI